MEKRYPFNSAYLKNLSIFIDEISFMILEVLCRYSWIKREHLKKELESRGIKVKTDAWLTDKLNELEKMRLIKRRRGVDRRLVEVSMTNMILIKSIIESIKENALKLMAIRSYEEFMEFLFREDVREEDIEKLSYPVKNMVKEKVKECSKFVEFMDEIGKRRVENWKKRLGLV